MFGPGLGRGLGRRGMRSYGRGLRNRSNQPYVIILALRLLQQIVNLPRKPPLTLALMAVMTALHLKPDLLHELFDVGGSGLWAWLSGDGQQFVRSVCLKPDVMLEDYERREDVDVKRLLLSAFVHADNMHLYYNMASFLFKGVSLELAMGSAAYAFLIAFTLITSQVLLFISSWGLMAVFGVDGPMHTCTVGFSGVLFALKYVLSRRSSDTSKFMGYTVHTKYTAWLELGLISLLVPNASFLGHLCGILAGIIYEEIPAIFSDFAHVPKVYVRSNQATSYTYSRGSTGERGDSSDVARGVRGQMGYTSTPSATDDTEEVEIQEAIRRSLQDGGQGDGMCDWVNVDHAGNYDPSAGKQETPHMPSPSAPPLEDEDLQPDPADGASVSGGEPSLGSSELRRRRLQRFGDDRGSPS